MEFFSKTTMSQNILVLLLIIYLIMGYNTPLPIATLVDTMVGKIVIIFIVIQLFIFTNPILAVLGAFAAYDLIRRSSIATGNFGIQNYLPNETSKMDRVTSYNEYYTTLEQEMVKKMVPNVSNNLLANTYSWVPSKYNTYDAAPAKSN